MSRSTKRKTREIKDNAKMTQIAESMDKNSIDELKSDLTISLRDLAVERKRSEARGIEINDLRHNIARLKKENKELKQKLIFNPPSESDESELEKLKVKLRNTEALLNLQTLKLDTMSKSVSTLLWLEDIDCNNTDSEDFTNVLNNTLTTYVTKKRLEYVECKNKHFDNKPKRGWLSRMFGKK